MRAIAVHAQAGGPLRTAVLTALHIADELLRLQKDHGRLEQQVEAKTLEYTALLDDALKQ